jgi:hypothetical protein
MFLMNKKTKNNKEYTSHLPLKTGYSATRRSMQRACEGAGEWGLRIT